MSKNILDEKCKSCCDYDEKEGCQGDIEHCREQVENKKQKRSKR